MARFSFSNSPYGSAGGFSLFPPVIKSLMIINVVVFLIEVLFLQNFSLFGSRLSGYFTQYFALWPLNNNNFGVWQLLSYQFMHGGFWHIAMNMFWLWMFGMELETVWGSRRFLTYYLVSGIGAGAIHLIVNSLLGIGGPTVGASGAIYGILIAFAMTFPDRPIMMFPIFFPMPAWLFVVGYTIIDLISAFSGSDGVAHFAHLGGALTGFILIKFPIFFNLFDKIGTIFSKKTTVIPPSHHKANIYNLHDTPGKIQSPAWFRSEEVNYHEEITQEKIDAILDKIAHSGMGSLTQKEREILKEASRKV